MKRLLFFALATLSLVPSAFGYDTTDRSYINGPGKWAAGAGQNWGNPLQPQVAASPVCHNIKERIETRKGHVIYRTHQVCA